MFKIESYIAPIILNHVAKYVKNIRPQDAQLSLWEGEAAFQNLDLRLDVLEEELNLPFEFLSGHIHELTIHVPWTKITSEPIKITINTIEFVLKLKDSKDDATTAAATSPNHHNSKEKKRKATKLDEGQLTGYVPAMVNKIINNIMVNCHNIILKYVEEDIVVSMNVQLLSFSSADEFWNPDFIDINPVKVLLRKLVQISDLTICLDKRNSAGQIDVCQEPILYRCTLELRILRKYNALSMNIASTTRIGIFTKLMEMNVSSLQFPMAMRLYKLVMALKSGELKGKSVTDLHDEEDEDQENSTNSGDSYLSWAWNLIPSFTFEEPQVEEKIEEAPGHTTDIGVYIETLNFTLKNSEFISDSIVGATKKIRYSPIVRLSLSGIYFETVDAEELNWSNIKAGLSRISIDPLGIYIEDAHSALHPTQSFIRTTTPTPVMNRAFLDKSLFDENCLIAEKGWVVTNFEEYCNRITEEYLLFRSPIIAMDCVDYRQSQHTDSSSTLNLSEGKFSGQQRVSYRILASAITFRYNQTFSRILAMVKELIRKYDYPSYIEEKPEGSGSPKLHPPLMDDYDSLMLNIPIRAYKFDLKKITLELYAKAESPHTSAKAFKRLPSSLKQELPYFALQVEHAECQWKAPLDPDKLVHTTCQLPDKPRELLDACYDNFQVRFKDVSLSLVDSCKSCKLICIPKAHVIYGDLLQPHLWKDEEIAVRKIDVVFENLFVEFSKRELITSTRLLKCVKQYHHYAIAKLAHSKDTYSAKHLTKIQNQFGKIKITSRKFQNISLCCGSLTSLFSEINNGLTCDSAKNLLLNTVGGGSENRWLEWHLQYPNDFTAVPGNVAIKSVLAVWLEQFNLSIDVNLLNFLQYQEEADIHFEKESSGEMEIGPPTISTNQQRTKVVQRSSRKSTERITRKISHPEETIHFSSERDEKIDVKSTVGLDLAQESSYSAILPLIKSLIICIEAAQANIYLAENLEKQSVSGSDYTHINLPKVVFKSALAEHINRAIVRSEVPQKSSLASNPTTLGKDTLPWKFTISDFSIQNRVQNQMNMIVHPIQTTITIAMTHKKEALNSAVLDTKTTDALKPIDETDGAKKSVKKLSENLIVEKKTQIVIDPVPTSEGNRRRSGGCVRSVSPNGRSDSSDENEKPEKSYLDTEHGTCTAGATAPAAAATLTGAAAGKSYFYDAVDCMYSGKAKPPSFKTKNERDVVAINLHIDTSPIHLEFSTTRTKIIREHLGLLCKVMTLMQTAPQKTTIQIQEKEAIQIVTALEENTNIKEFLDFETNSESSKLSDEKTTSKFVVSFLCQWTITKFILELEGNSKDIQHNKLIIDVEDLIATVDKREDFIKLTNKIGTFNMRYFEASPRGDWILNDSLRIKMLAETSQSPFFNMIATTVGLKNFFKRIGAKCKGDLNRSISEIVISMQAMEIILDLDKIPEFVPALCSLNEKESDIGTDCTANAVCAKNPYCGSDLPMIHLDSKGFTLYMPINSGKKWCTVSILKVGQIKISPNLENPLQRCPVRVDVYHKAAQMGILGTPGSIVEDRQYEITFKNISAASGNWNEILSHMKEHTDNFHNTNPAFEWNNQSRKASLELREIFKDFTFITIYAPLVVYNKVLVCGQAIEFNCSNDFVASLTTDQLNLLSCMIVRFHNISNIIEKSSKAATKKKISSCDIPSQRNSVTASTSDPPGNSVSIPQSQSLTTITHTTKKLKKQSSLDMQTSSSLMSFDSMSDTNVRLRSNSRTKESFCDLIEESSDRNFTDSGFCSFQKAGGKKTSKLSNNDKTSTSNIPVAVSASGQHQKQQSLTKVQLHRQIPSTLSFVAGIFVFKFFDYCRKETSENNDNASDKEEKVTPLISFTICQPNILISQSIYDTTTHISLFNLTVTLSRPTKLKSSSTATIGLTAKGDIDVESSPKTSLQFPTTIFDTKRGVLSSSGIPPPLLAYKSHQTKSNKLEIDLTISKPGLVFLSEEIIEQLTRTTVLLYKTLLQNPCFDVRSELPIFRGTKIQIMRNLMFNADRLSLNLDQLSVKFSRRKTYKIRIVLADLKFSVKFLSRPEKLTAKGSIGACYAQTEHKICLHPVGVKLSADLVQESWHRLPLVTANVKFNVIHFDIGVQNIEHYRNALKGLTAAIVAATDEWQTFTLSRTATNSAEEISRERLMQIHLPNVQRKGRKYGAKTPLYKEEFYQDDLRAGAFQFVEMVSDSFLPLPYQIQIIKKNFGIVCWRYPQPRKMCKIYIFPVPMAVANPIHIKCRMEYFSESHESFLHFCDFWLSETVSKYIDLPEREITANIWRVVILQSLVSINGECFDTSEEDEEMQSITSLKIEDMLTSARKESDFILHPKVLVGCMRIDTIFKPSSIPKVQLLLSVNRLQVNLQNQQLETAELPAPLKKYQLAPNSQISQTFLSLVVERCSFHATIHTLDNYSLNCDLVFCVKCLDYGFLNMLYLIEETSLNGYFRIKNESSVITNIVADRIKLNLGPSIVHTLLTSKMHWEEALTESDTHVIITKFTIVNRTHLNIAFGQTGTNERIQLQPKECHMYSFRSDYFDQEVTFFIADEEMRIIETSSSVPITLDFGPTSDTMRTYIRVADKCLNIKTKKLSATQAYILIKGQIELLSMVADEFRLEFRGEGTSSGSASELTATCDYTTEAYDRITFFQRVSRDTNIFMRLKYKGAKGKGRTGDIPLKANKNLPWLVKVPTVSNVANQSSYISYWVRILREDIDILVTDKFQPQKILITIWPIFEIRSMMTCPISAVESTTNENFKIAERGGRHHLRVPATHQTDHKIKFNENFSSYPEEKQEFNLSLKAIDWNKFFWYDEKVWTVTKAVVELSKTSRKKWPFADDEEDRVQRDVTNVDLDSRISTLFRCYPSREFSCSLSLEVAPWGTFLNASGQRVAVRNIETNDKVVVNSNHIAMLASVKTAFTIDIQNGTSWLASLPIYFDKAVADSASSKQKRYLLSENSITEVVILKGDQVFKFLLQFKRENGRNIFILKAKFLLTNFTSQKFIVLPFTMDHKETTTRSALAELDTADRGFDVVPTNSSENCIGIALDWFIDLNVRNLQRSTDTAFVCFLCLKADSKTEVSIPIALTLQFNRKCFSLQQESKSIPLMASLIEKGGQYYLSIFDDISPAFLLSNQTDLTLMLAQTGFPEGSKVNNVTAEYDGKHFEWFQLVTPRSQLYYTPPELYNTFPDIEQMMCNLTIALYNDKQTKKSIKWSKPIRTDTSFEKFLHVPNHGDVKVIVCDKHKIIRVSIFYIAQQLEFSVKDLRSRLLTSHATLDVLENTTLSAEKSDELSYLGDAPLQRVKSTLSSKCMHFRQDMEAHKRRRLNIRLFVKEINVNIFTDSKTRDYIKTEIFALCVDDFMVTFCESERNLSILLCNLQIDNQLFSSGNYDFPVVLCSQELYKRKPILPSVHSLDKTYDELHHNPMVLISLNFYDDELKLRTITCKLNPIRAYIEDTYLNDFLDALIECEPNNVVFTPKRDRDRLKLEAGCVLLPKDVAAQAICMSEPMKLQSFRIEPMNVMLSVHTCVRLYIALDHSPLQFSTYERQQILTLPLRFGHTLGMHYLSGALFGAGWVVGSLEILGSPSGLARSFSLGLRDFVSMPVQGLLRGPWGFVMGITQGSASLLRNITAGTVNSVTKLAGSVARNLDRLTLDPEHIQRTEALRRSRPQGFTEGFSQGMTGLGISMLGAVGGIARHTLEARSPVQVMTGMGKGIVGAFTKPISGAAELLALTGQGVLHTVGFNAMPQQRSPSISRNIANEAADYRIWKLLPNVLATDQILFYHEATLVLGKQLRRSFIFLTSTVFAVRELDKDKLSFVISVNKVDAAFDKDDKTMINVRVKQDSDEFGEDYTFTNQRIMNFLRSSTSGLPEMTTDSLDDLIKNNDRSSRSNTSISSKNCLEWSFYIGEDLGQYLIQYLKIINLKLNQ